MARTNLPLSTFTSGADLNDAGTTVDQANGMNIQLPSTAIPVGGSTDRLILYVTNTAAATHVVTIRAGTSLPPAFEGGKGDVTTGNLTASTGTAFIGPFEPARFVQSDGSVNVDFDSGFTGKIWAILLPRVPQI